MARHRLDAEQVRGLDHPGALQGVGGAGALPQVAAVEQQGTSRAGVAAQPLDQRPQMRKAAEPAESNGGFFEVEGGESIGVGAIGRDPESIEKGAADQMRRPPLHRAEPEIDAGFTKIPRQELRMRVGHMQDARIAEALEVVDAGIVGAARDTRQRAGERGRACEFEKIPAADCHAMFPLGSMVLIMVRFQRISRFFQASLSLVAWKMDALASASASFARANACSKSPFSAAFLASAKAVAVTVH